MKGKYNAMEHGKGGLPLFTFTKIANAPTFKLEKQKHQRFYFYQHLPYRVYVMKLLPNEQLC